MDYQKYVVSREGKDITLDVNGEELKLKVRSVPWSLKNSIISRCSKFVEGALVFDGDAYVKESLKRTHAWAKICLKEVKSKQALFGIVQGSKYKDLREESAKFINSLGFPGYGIGGDLGEDKPAMQKILSWIMPLLDEQKPRHLLGIGYLDDMENIIKSGVDTFDCTVPTHYARRGIAFT